MATEEVVLRLSLQQRRETARGLKDTEREVRSIGTAAEDAGRRVRNGLGSALRGIGGAAMSAAKYGGIALGALATAGAGWGTKVVAANEQAQISFTTMLGSAEKAGAFITDLQAFAAKTPFEFSGLQQSASSLISAGIEASRVIPIMTSLGNATSGMGTGAEGIQRATVALQQMNAAGRITGEDLNQLRDAGIPVFDLLAAATGKSVEQVAELAQQGKLGRQELEQLMSALETGRGLERFNGLMDKQSRSLTGMWSSFTDTISMGLGRVMQPWLPALKSVLGDATGASSPFFDGLLAKSERLAERAPVWISRVRAGLREGKANLDDFMAGFSGDQASGQLADIGQSVRTIVDNVSGVDLGSMFSGASNVLPTLNAGLQVAGVVTGFLADNADTLSRLMPLLVAGFVAFKVAQLGANAASALGAVTQWRQVAATRALAASNTALAAQVAGTTLATQANTVAENAGLLTRIRGTVAIAAQKAGMIAVRVATVAWTAAQWLLNVALTANPIGLVVAAVALLAAGVYLAYQRFEFFRQAIAWVWDKLKAFWDWVTGIGDALLGALGLGTETETKGYRDIPGRATGGDVQQDQPYIVGERRPELFVPRVDGTILPRIPTARRSSDTDGALAGLASPSAPTHVHVEVDGREIGRATINDLRDRQARK